MVHMQVLAGHAARASGLLTALVAEAATSSCSAALPSMESSGCRALELLLAGPLDASQEEAVAANLVCGVSL